MTNNKKQTYVDYLGWFFVGFGFGLLIQLFQFNPNPKKLSFFINSEFFNKIRIFKIKLSFLSRN